MSARQVVGLHAPPRNTSWYWLPGEDTVLQGPLYPPMGPGSLLYSSSAMEQLLFPGLFITAGSTIGTPTSPIAAAASGVRYHVVAPLPLLDVALLRTGTAAM